VRGAELLTVSEMAEADRLAVEAGVPSLTLMENAGRAVAEAVVAHYEPAAVAVLCGPGNNGGDGYVAARHLKARGWKVWVESVADPATLKGDAAEMFKRWDGETRVVTRARKADIVVDAIFGAGLTRPLDMNMGVLTRALNESGIPVVAVDVPSGLHGDLGRPLGEDCVRAHRTVTFFRKKPGHVLLPGRALCGEVMVASIGIPEQVLETIPVRTFENGPPLWRDVFPWPRLLAHKYSRGHAIVVSGPMHATGAARLAARGALRTGAGLVSVASPPGAVAVNAAQLTAIMVKPFDGPKGLSALLSDKRFNAMVLGPGAGVGDATQDLVAAALGSSAAVVLDADALTSFADNPQGLFAQLRSRCVLTPHEGELERLFPGLLAKGPTRLDAARQAALSARSVVVLKGPDTVIAAPDGRAAVNSNAPPWLATAGTGDVLAGMIAGLLAQKMDPFEAACAAVWLHGEAATRFDVGLIAEDLPEQLPHVLRLLRSMR
jgi:NAD(P)H-hydrate epimerase